MHKEESAGRATLFCYSIKAYVYLFSTAKYAVFPYADQI